MRALGSVLIGALPWLPFAADCRELKTGKASAPAVNWLHVDKQAVADGHAAEIYQRLWIENFLPPPILAQPAELERIRASDEFKYTEARSDIRIYKDGYWGFENPHEQRWPTRAVRVTFPDPAIYKLNVVAYCESSEKDCAGWLDSLLHMKAPQPDGALDSEIGKQWQEIVMREPCSNGPFDMSAPKYPSPAVWNGISGRVVTLLLINPCGEVRGAWIQASSRNRDLDRAALDKVRSWRIDLSQHQLSTQLGALVRVPVDFIHPADEKNHDSGTELSTQAQ